MERRIKHEIAKMLIPVIGTYWVLKRILPDLNGFDWWDSDKGLGAILSLFAYQAICWIGWKVFYMMYFFEYSFNQVFEQW